ncbi:hypothetical protein [Teredinibacter franksiae]|uniref:hypothetical protein n=1 Tax=Teredinibacter franksiae TaxID=2761453 RepID=UPI001628CD80|nr:hypothetical protein [Teredinibacter franksiae]
MDKVEIVNCVKILWENVKKDCEFSYEIIHEVDRFLNGELKGLEGLKELGTGLYKEVGRSNYPDGDIRRDGIRSMSHFVMGYWDIASDRENESKRRLQIATSGMNNYLSNHANA